MRAIGTKIFNSPPRFIMNNDTVQTRPSPRPSPLLTVAEKSIQLATLCLKIENEGLLLSHPVSESCPEQCNIDLFTEKLYELNTEISRLKIRFERELIDPDAYKSECLIVF